MTAALLAVLLAQGGPPLRTDDAGTPGDGHSELNVAFTVEKFRHSTLYEAPLLDFNYGIGERIQVKVELPWLVRRDHCLYVPDLGKIFLAVPHRDRQASEVRVFKTR